MIPKPKEKAGRANVPKTIVVTNLNIEWWRAWSLWVDGGSGRTVEGMSNEATQDPNKIRSFLSH